MNTSIIIALVLLLLGLWAITLVERKLGASKMSWAFKALEAVVKDAIQMTEQTMLTKAPEKKMDNALKIIQNNIGQSVAKELKKHSRDLSVLYHSKVESMLYKLGLGKE